MTCVAAVYLKDQPWWRSASLSWRSPPMLRSASSFTFSELPSLIVTLGMSFIWLGAAILVLSSPGGAAPPWLVDS